MRRLAIAVSALAVLALPAPALAATASKSGSTVTVNGAGFEDNRLTTTVSGLNLQITETGSGVGLTAGIGCVTGGTNIVNCPLAGTTLLDVNGNSGGDFLVNNTGLASALDGGSDSDVLVGGTGADILTGGTSNDYVSYAGRTSSVTANLDGAAGDGQSGENDTIAADVETLIGGDAVDTLTGNAADNGLDGGPGADNLNGGDGNDYVLYWTRANAVTVTFDGVANDGEAGENDVLGGDVESAIGGNGNDTLSGGAGDNDLYGWDGDDTLSGGGGADDLYGLDGNDTVTYAGRTDDLTVDLDSVADDGAPAEGDNAVAENLTGGSGDDSLTGEPGVNALDGGPGDDVLDGGLGADPIAGGTGTDRATYASRTGVVTADVDDAADDGETGENDNLASDIENLTGGQNGDSLTGSAAANVLDGGPGADTLNGLGGADTVTYASRTAAVTADIDGTADDGEAGENDNIATDVEDLIGGSEADTLTGSAAANVLDGGPGGDTLNGLGGADRVTYASRTTAVTADLDGTADDGEAGEADQIAADVENLTGGAGADDLTGSAAVNKLDGGAGADTLRSRDTSADQVTCGSSSDSVIADTADDAAADCESVSTPTPPTPPAAPKVTVAAKPKAKALKVRLSKAPITLGKDGKAPVTIACPKGQVGGCAGTVTIDVAAEPAAGGKAQTSRRSRRRVIGKARFKVAAGKKKKIRVRLSRRGRRKVLRKRKMRCRVSVTNKGQDGKLVTTRQTVAIKAPKLKVRK